MLRHTSSSVFDAPAYRAAEAARVLALPAATVNAWCFGHDYLHADGSAKRFARVIEPANARGRELSFVNLCELHVLASIRRHHGVKLPAIRRAVQYVTKELGIPRPLATEKFLTNGVGLFVEHAGELLNVSQQGQRAMREEFERALTRIEFDKASGGPVVLFPFTREPHAGAELPKAVVVDPTRSFGRPMLVKACVRTDVIEQRFRAGDSIAEMALDYGVAEAEIEEALRFESRRAA